MVIKNSTIRDNTAGEGGGVHNEGGDVSIDSSTINANSAQFGGGIAAFGGTTNINSSTITGNSASDGGGVSNNSGTITISNSTIAGNSAGNIGGGISAFSSVVLSNSIVANNQGAADCAGARIKSQGYNVDSDNTCNLSAVGDLPDRDPLLGPLQDNGGATFTHALLSGSPAIDAGSCSGAVADQRGYARPADLPDVPNMADACDIGAFERQPVSIDFSAFLPVMMAKK